MTGRPLIAVTLAATAASAERGLSGDILVLRVQDGRAYGVGVTPEVVEVVEVYELRK